MIRAVLIMNESGVPRMMKFYESLSFSKQQQLIRSLHKALKEKETGSSTFIYDEKKFGTETTIIYRQYATLYFIFCVDKSESELGILNLIQIYVEALNKVIPDVREFDLLFQYTKAQQLLDEFVFAGQVIDSEAESALQLFREKESVMKQSQNAPTENRKIFSNDTTTNFNAGSRLSPRNLLQHFRYRWVMRSPSS